MAIFNEDIETQEVRIGQIDEGNKFITSVRASQVTDGTARAIYFENPSGAIDDAYLVVKFDSSGRGQVTIAENVSHDGTGSGTTVINAKPGAGTPDSVTRTNDAYTINGSQLEFVLPGGDSKSGGSGAAAPTTFLLDPGNTMLFRTTNVSGGAADIGVSISWFEVEI